MKKIEDFVEPIEEKKPVEEKAIKETIKTKIVDEPVKIHTTVDPKKIKPRVCPFCKERRKARGIKNHIELKHNIPGISIQDLDEVSEGSRTLEDLVKEKIKGDDKAFMTNVLDEVREKDLPSWKKAINEEENPEGPEKDTEKTRLDPNDKREAEEEIEKIEKEKKTRVKNSLEKFTILISLLGAGIILTKDRIDLKSLWIPIKAWIQGQKSEGTKKEASKWTDPFDQWKKGQ